MALSLEQELEQLDQQIDIIHAQRDRCAEGSPARAQLERQIQSLNVHERQAIKEHHYRYPAHLAPSLLLMLAAHQAGYDFSDMPDLGPMLNRVIAGQIDIDTSPAAFRRVLRAMNEADDRKKGIVHVWVEDLLLSAEPECYQNATKSIPMLRILSQVHGVSRVG